MAAGSTLLLVGASVRMLAQSAARAGFRPISLDWFADTDTERCSAVCRSVSSGAGFDCARLLALADEFAPRGRNIALIYAGGFDGDPDLLQHLAEGRTLWGNCPDTVRAVRSPRHFFSSLDRLGLSYPEVRWEHPGDQQAPFGWLIKRAGSEGGAEVRWASLSSETLSPTPPDTYYQRRVPGTACSVLFLANGADARIIGINILSSDSSEAARPYRFAGARTRHPPEQGLYDTLQPQVTALTQAFALRGINSVDFVLHAEQVWVLELNPRISATLCLYDADYPDGLLARHIAACRGRLPGEVDRTNAVRAFKILYARRSGAVPADLAWPAWSADRPRGGTNVRAGQPICSIIAVSEDHAGLDALLSTRERTLRRALML